MDANTFLSAGFFPKEFPPPFRTQAFAEHLKRNAREPSPAPRKKNLITKSAIHNLARPGGQRRRLQIPNPFSYYKVCNLLEKNWSVIEKHFKLSPYSMSLPTTDPSGLRAAKPQLDGSELGVKRAKVRSSARFLLRTDISRFYSSIYTHSIPWALEGKAIAKKSRKGGFANHLDEALRDLQDGQTLGIPIGPDASLVIAEIIACAIDMQIANRGLEGMRFMDDYEFGFTSRSAAEAGLVFLEETLADFELAVNQSKTSIEQLPVELDRGWNNEIKSYSLGDTGDVSAQELINYFNRVFELKTKYPADAVLAYAVARLRRITVSDWELLQNIVCQCALSEPGAMESVVTLLQANSELPLTDAIDKLISNTIDHHAPLSHGSEVAWALWASVWFKRSIPETVARKLEGNRDPVVAVLTLHAKELNLIDGDFSVASWATSMSANSLYGPQWLLAYEADIRSWLPSGNKEYVSGDPNFSRLKSDNVSFYDPSIEAPTKTLLQPTDTSSPY